MHGNSISQGESGAGQATVGKGICGQRGAGIFRGEVNGDRGKRRSGNGVMDRRSDHLEAYLSGKGEGCKIMD